VEESYLQESVEMMIIREQSRSDDRDGKLVALEYIREAIEAGNTGDEIRGALEYMGLEGILNQTRENGRLMNNFPDVRARAAEYLGNLGTPEARDALVKMLLIDNEPMVLTQVVSSLRKVFNAGVTENSEESAAAVAWILRRYDNIHPDNLLALSALDYFDLCGRSAGGIKDPAVIEVIRRVAVGRYIRPVQDRAKTLLSNLIKYSQQGGSGGSQGRQQAAPPASGTGSAP
ncbi:MAG: HEAT repeat domain-containing protein, partial [Spirochaetaceae bacterium]|jgi:hypothetical protein|nr:HEAT repeat domain-containing protein [Spirochaetaceae bacterium]